MNSYIGLAPLYGSSYVVAVSFTYLEITTGLNFSSGYGKYFFVKMSSFIIPTIGLISPACGSTLYTQGQTIVAPHTANALAYQLQARLTGDSVYY